MIAVLVRASTPLLLALASGLALTVAADAGDARAKQPPIEDVWTTIIPDAFPHYVYTWHIHDDGTYDEDGANRDGQPIQQTLAGHWTLDGAHLILRQNNDTFVFDGIVADGKYSGTMYLDGRKYSPFCSAQGDDAPKHCDSEKISSRASWSRPAG